VHCVGRREKVGYISGCIRLALLNRDLNYQPAEKEHKLLIQILQKVARCSFSSLESILLSITTATHFLTNPERNVRMQSLARIFRERSEKFHSVRIEDGKTRPDVRVLALVLGTDNYCATFGAWRFIPRFATRMASWTYAKLRVTESNEEFASPLPPLDEENNSVAVQTPRGER
jgi:hypothetical protein